MIEARYDVDRACLGRTRERNRCQSMTHEHAFDKDYWERQWRPGTDGEPGSMGRSPASPYLAHEIGGLAPGTALDAGCGAGAEALWLASRGWRVTAADISAEALARAERAQTFEDPRAAERVHWIEADLVVWEPGVAFDLVTTHYAHPSMPQLEFYDRLGSWVAPGGTLLIVGHLHTDDGRGHGHGHGQHPPAQATVSAATITRRLDEAEWAIVTADEQHRTLTDRDGREVSLQDVVVRAVRRT
jgi:SAM-dependent methyltransferase